MNRGNGILAVVLLAFTGLAGTFYVAPPERCDEKIQLGTRSNPFSTLQQARDAIRVQKKAGHRGPWTVSVAAGFYSLKETFTLSPEDAGTPDAPIRYQGEEGTILSGGMRLTGWRLRPSGIWEADLPTVKGRPAFFEMLYVNGRRAVRARHPTTGFFNPMDVRQRTITNQWDGTVQKGAFLTAKGDDLSVLNGLPKEDFRFAQLIVHHNWDTTRRILLDFNETSQTLFTIGREWKRWNPWRLNSLYYLENVRTAFDAPGEWFYDGPAGKVLYRPLPGESIDSSVFVAPVQGVATLLALKGDWAAGRFVSDIEFSNLSFCHSDSPRQPAQLEGLHLPESVVGKVSERGATQFAPQQAAASTVAAIVADGARKISFVRCSVTQTGEYGLWFREGCMSNRVEQCLFDDLGGGGIRIGSPSRNSFKVNGPVEVKTFTPRSTAFNTVDNCIITRGGRFHACAVAVWIGNSSDNRVTHCEIYDHFYTGVSIGWVWGYGGSVSQRNLLAFNRIGKIGQGVLGDMGGVYTLGTSFGTRICNNVVFDVDSYTYGGWGLYTDEGSEGIVMENNLVYDTKDGSFHQHYGRNNVIRNNILCYSKECQVAASRIEKHRGFTFTQNIVYWDQGPTFKERYRGTVKTPIDWHSNLWFRCSSPVDFDGVSFAERIRSGVEKGSICEDPRFINPSARDFRLHTDSPAFSIGFRPFDFSKAGVYGDSSWRHCAQEREGL